MPFVVHFFRSFKKTVSTSIFVFFLFLSFFVIFVAFVVFVVAHDYPQAFLARRDYTGLSMFFRLTKYGRREWIIASVLLGAFIAAAVLAAWPRWTLSLVSVIPLAILWAWVLWFFRDPHRRPPQDPNLLVSPADGRVTDITPIGAESELGCEGVKIGIFMSVFDVHVNRSPVEATVKQVRHAAGAFLDAARPAILAAK